MIATDPPGAAVFLDGTSRGTTPLALDRIPAGEHRVRVSLAGYLDHSRAIVVRAGESTSLRFNLTPAAASSSEPAAGEKAGGSRKKMALIGAGVAAAAVVGYAVLSGGDELTVSGVTADPSGIGLAAVTLYTFSAAISPSGGTLSYAWNFGDGQASTLARPTHTYATDGTFPVTVTVTDSDGRAASGSAQVVVRSLTGTWVGTLQELESTTLMLTQSGTQLTGAYSDEVGGTGTVSGTVSAPRSAAFKVTVSPFPPWFFEGVVDGEVNRLEGLANGGGFANEIWSLRRQ